MRIPIRILFALSLGVFTGVLVYGRPLALSGQDTKAGQSKPTTSGQQGGAAGGAKPGQAGQSTGTPAGPTAEENQAYQAISSELAAGLDYDKVVSLADAFAQKYTTSTLLSFVYTLEASAYQQKGDVNKTVEAGEKSLKLNGDNLLSLIIMSTMLPQPQLMQGSDLEKQKRLAEAEADANHSLDLIEKLQKQPNETDDQLKKRKDNVASEPHGALGMIHLQRAATASLTAGGMDPEELSKSAVEFKKSVDMPEHSAPQNYYRLGEVYEHENKIDDAIAAFSKASELGQGSAIQAYADKQIEDLKKRQAQAKPPATH